MVQPRRKLTACDWAGYGLTILGAAFSWIALISALSLGVTPSASFIAVLVLITILAVVPILFVDTPINPLWAYLRWDDRRTRTGLYEDLVRAYRALDVAPYDEHRADLEDTIRHLRTAACVLNDWDPRTECDTGGLADRSVLEYWERHYPEDFRLHR